MGVLERWLVSLESVNGRMLVKPQLTYVHSAVSHWFDHRPAEGDANPEVDGGAADRHDDMDKDWTVAEPRAAAGRLVVEVSCLTASAIESFAAAVRPGTGVRFGTQHCRVAQPPFLLARRTWAELATGSADVAWWVTAVTPMSFRRGDHTTPLFNPVSALKRLAERWATFSPGFPAPARDVGLATWVTDLNGSSQVREIRPTVYSGFVGSLRIESTPEAAPEVGALLALAEFSGIGAGTTRGLGQVVVASGRRSSDGHARTRMSDPVSGSVWASSPVQGP